MSAEQRRRIHQKALAEQKHQEGLARYADKGSQSKSDEKQVFKRFDSYKKETQLPNETRDLKVKREMRERERSEL